MSVGKLLETLRRNVFNISEHSCSCECIHDCLFFFNQILSEHVHVDGGEVATVLSYSHAHFSQMPWISNHLPDFCFNQSKE